MVKICDSCQAGTGNRHGLISQAMFDVLKQFQKKEVEEHHRISSISKKTKSVATYHDACVSRYLKHVNARTKKPNVVPISVSKPKRKANKSVATPHKKTVASDTTIQKSKSYFNRVVCVILRRNFWVLFILEMINLLLFLVMEI
ncbi:hypothetical protein Tco_0188314 [Tanacetum coccineum]